MKILPLAKIAAAKKRLIEKETTMKLDVDALWAKALGPHAEDTIQNYTRLIIEECAKVCRNEKVRAYTADDQIMNATCDACAAAIRELKP